MAAVFVFSIHTVGRNLKAFLVQHDGYGAMLDSGVDGATEQLLYLLRSRRGGDIPVLRGSPQNGIPHTAAYHIGFESGRLNSFYNIFCLIGYLYLNHTSLSFLFLVALSFRFHDELIDDFHQSVFIVGAGDIVRRFLDRRLGIPHCYAGSRIFDHGDVVVTVPAADRILSGQSSIRPINQK